MVVDSVTGEMKQKIKYSDWGEILEDTSPGLIPFGYAGGMYDQDTKLVRFGARDYDPQIGRWTSKDPILFGGGDTNLYGYVMQDPINLIDPLVLAVGDWWDLSANFGMAQKIAAEELSKRSRGHNNMEDAMRHAEWSRRMVEEINPFTAWAAGTGHELQGLFKGQPWSEMMMDLHNNRIGRDSAGGKVNSNSLWTLPLNDSEYNPYSGVCGQ